MEAEPTGPKMSIERYSEQQQSLLRELFHAGAILFGDVIRSRFGLHSPIYIDLRECIYARPELLWQVGREFAEKIRELAAAHPVPQCVVGIPDTATPLALATALYAWQEKFTPPITYAMLRKEAKVYPGLPARHWIGRRDQACEYNLIDDVVASGLTKRASAAKMQREGISVRRIIVLFDREQGDGLRGEGFEMHGIFRVPDVLDFYRRENLIRPQEHDQVIRFLRSRRFDSVPTVK
jgi:orotate phosphoribosyltransferase